MFKKRRGITKGLETVLIMSALALAVCLAVPRAAHAQNLQIFAVNPLDFGPASGDDNEVTATCDNTAASDPVLFYDNTVTTTAAIDVMLVTISAVGDADGGNRLEIQCTVDGAPCKTGNIGDDGASKGAMGAPAGWVVLQRCRIFSGNEVCEEVPANYTWCVPITKTKKNQHNVKLSLANTALGNCPNDVTLEQVNVIVEGFHAGKSTLATNACKSVGVSEHNS